MVVVLIVFEQDIRYVRGLGRPEDSSDEIDDFVTLLWLNRIVCWQQHSKRGVLSPNDTGTVPI